MKRLIHIIALPIGAIVLSLLILTGASAQTPPITINLLSSKAVYQPGDPIHMQIDVLNSSGQDVVTQEGFISQHFYLRITFTDPDGQPVTTKYKEIGYEGGPPYRAQGKDAAFVEVILAGARDTDVIEDAKNFYDLPKYGRYKAQVFAFLETFSKGTQDPDTGRLIAFLDEQTGAYTLSSNTVSFEILSPTPVVQSPIEVKVGLMKIGTGTKPPVEKRPLDGVKDGVSVRLYRRLAAAVYEPINWKTYSLIWNDNSVVPLQVILPDSQGMATFNMVSKDDYILLTLYGDTFAGSNVDADDPNWGTSDPIERHLTIMQKADGKKAPGKTTKKTGSLLLITEPEYIEWDSNRELYPFVFETIDTWGVITSVSPPEGFVSDYKSLDAQVNNETEAVQFTITDIGSKWEETKVKYKIQHKGHTETIESKIGIKLSKKLADKKGKGIYGDTEGPGVFEGGKRIDKKAEGGKGE